MTAIQPDRIPATPVYAVVLTAHGAVVDGEPVEALPEHDTMMAALAELRRRAALRGRPVRATAKAPGGSVQHIIVTPDGEVTELPEPHPQPRPEPQPQRRPVLAPPPTQPMPTIAPRPRTSRPAQQAPQRSSAAARPPAAAASPEDSDTAWRKAADERAEQFEQKARTQHGPASTEAARWAQVRHQIRTAPAPWAAATELWIAALTEGLAAHHPANSPALLDGASTAYGCWLKIADPAEAADTGARLLAVVKQLDYPELLAAVERWAHQAADIVASWAPPTATEALNRRDG